MLHSDSGTTTPVKFDPNFITSDRCVIVLDEPNDTCWVWLGKDAGMVNRRTTLRLARSLKRLGYPMKGGNICVGLKKLVEIDERMDDEETQNNLNEFKAALQQKYKIKDDLIAVIDESTGGKGSKSSVQIERSEPVEEYEQIVKPSSLVQEQKQAETLVSSEPEPYERNIKPSEVIKREEEALAQEGPMETQPTVTTGKIEKTEMSVDEKLGIILKSVLSAAGLAYVEYQQVEKNSEIIKVDCGETFSFSIIIEGDSVQVHPEDLGAGDTGRKIMEMINKKIK